MSAKALTFSIYRYQIVPLHTSFQTTLFGQVSSYQDLIDKKNDFFLEVVNSPKTRYRGHGYNVLSQIEYNDKGTLILHLGVEKTREIHREDFKSTYIKDYPNIYVYVDNNPQVQIIAIQNNLDTFTDTDAVANILKDAYSKALARYELTVYIEQTFDQKEFWTTIEQHEGRITNLLFEFIKPNLANISKSAVEQLKLLKNSVNSHKTDLEFKAPKGGTLENLTPDNTEIAGLVEYNQEGGGPSPRIKIKGLRYYIKTTKSEKTIELAEVEGSPEKIAKLLKKLLK
jgi:hypothetical protein